ncbi:YlcI/YnfO family protein [Aquisalimonas sp.]|uniref:YlcI/YnfO family protein n=1 Tax=Aquisalimonas sp. TaxID=1872621 RepID=UPI0025C2BB5E|nr:YlcI/YnfO family protein [Aquisalimonas sp.]
MKSATIPPLRVDPRLRADVESVLNEGETLSAFVEESLRAHIARRRNQKAFIERGLGARVDAQKSGEYYDSETVLEGLEAMLESARQRHNGS